MKGIPAPFVRANQWFLVISTVGAFVSGQYWILAVPFIIGAFSLLTGKNPIFNLVRPFLKEPLSDYPMEDPLQQRFNQYIAVICLAISLIGFVLGKPVIGYVFAGMVGSAALVALMGFCIGCFIRYQFLRLRLRLKQNNRA